MVNSSMKRADAPVWLWMGALVPLALLLSACGHSFDVKEQSEQFEVLEKVQKHKPERMPVVVVTEPFFSGDFESYEIYQKSYDVVDELTRRGVPSIAPWEYRTHRKNAGVVLGSNVTWLMNEEGVALDDAVRLEVRVVMLGGSQRVAVHGRPGGDNQSVSYVQPGEIRIAVKPMRSEDVLASLVVEFEEDPLARDVTVFDKRPQLKRALRYATAEVSEMLYDAFPAGPAGERPKMEVTFNPKPMFSYKASSRSSPLAEKFSGMGAMEGVAQKLRYYQYFDPSIGMDRVMDFEGRKGGLLVEKPGDLARFGVQSGDYITAVSGRAALGPQVLARPLLHHKLDNVVIELERGGEYRRVSIPLGRGSGESGDAWATRAP